MREHIGLFRGKRCDNGEWVEGFLLGMKLIIPKGQTAYKTPDNYLVVPNVRVYAVDPETVGECTGLRDKNGKLIFEGDVLGQGASRGTVEYDPEKAAYMYQWRMWGNHADPRFKICKLSDYGFLRNLEIIGNIHDNPDVMG